jgi:hypothetical protein
LLKEKVAQQKMCGFFFCKNPGGLFLTLTRPKGADFSMTHRYLNQKRPFLRVFRHDAEKSNPIK